MRMLMMSLFGLAVAGAPALAQEPPKKVTEEKVEVVVEEPLTPAQQLKTIQSAYSKAQAEAMEEYTKAKPEDRAKLVPKIQKKLAEIPTEQFAQQALDLAKSLKNDDPVAFDALMYSVNMGRTKGPKIVKEATELLMANHIENPKIGMLFNAISMTKEGQSQLEAIAKKAKNADVAAQAWFAIAEGVKEATGEPGLSDKEINALNLKAESIYEKISTEFSEAKNSRGQNMAELAKTALFEIRNLAIGKTAPEVTCLNVKGEAEDKLSNYKGSVVVLDIWATWCGPCKAMIPHEREMVERLKGKKFTLISVSGDDKLETLTSFLEKEEMPWTHWFAERKGILKDWNIRYYPTIYVIDHKGVIRAKDIRGDKLEAKVVELLEEMEKGSK